VSLTCSKDISQTFKRVSKLSIMLFNEAAVTVHFVGHRTQIPGVGESQSISALSFLKIASRAGDF